MQLLEVKKAEQAWKNWHNMLRAYGTLQKVLQKKRRIKRLLKLVSSSESLGVSTHLKDYGLGTEAIDKIVKHLKITVW